MSFNIDVDKYAAMWGISEIASGSLSDNNVVLPCDSERYGPAVLKALSPREVDAREMQMLADYAGRKICRLYEADYENNVFLMERVVPGESLWEIGDYAERARIAAAFMADFNLPCARPEVYPSYMWLHEKICGYMRSFGRAEEELHEHIERSLNIHRKLLKNFGSTCLLHGDLHQDNMLRAADGDYIAIDPKGMVGDPVFETSRYILNEFDLDAAKIEDKIGEIIEIFESATERSARIIALCLYVDTAITSCWEVESGGDSDELERVRACCRLALKLTGL